MNLLKRYCVALLLALFLLPAAFWANDYAAISAQYDPASNTPSSQKRNRKFGGSVKRDSNKSPNEQEGLGRTQTQSKTDSNLYLRMKTELTVQEVTVTNHLNEAIADLKETDFQLVEDDVIQEIKQFAFTGAKREPISMVLVFDRSASQGGWWKRNEKSAELLVDMLDEADEMAVVSDSVNLICDFTKDKQQIKQSLRKHWRNWQGGEGSSRNVDALVATLRELTVEKTNPVIIWQTDGDQLFKLSDKPECHRYGTFKTKYDSSEFYRTVQNHKVRIYPLITCSKVIGYDVPEARAELGKFDNSCVNFSLGDKGVRCLLEVQEKLNTVAKLSGGWAEWMDQPLNAEEIYKRILAASHQRYLFAYYPTNTARDGKWREVKVTVKGHPEYIVRGRKGYYAAKD